METLERSPDLIDVEVGRRLRRRREVLGMSQMRLAEAIGVTFQQVQKYERGKNRVSASRLWQVGKALGVTIDYFFEDIDEVARLRVDRPQLAPLVALADDPFERPKERAETLVLVRLFNAQPMRVRDCFLALLDSVGKGRRRTKDHSGEGLASDGLASDGLAGEDDETGEE